MNLESDDKRMKGRSKHTQTRDEPFVVELEFDPVAEWEKRLLGVYEFLLNADEEIGHVEK
ncbi:hypothetical protein ACFL2Z_00895 [Candidatus Eisenbacteria bacterium]|uniref:Uncharacterized protein n=1 Tax=Eiseniibacteriota bacterium TaxID=2212470 RepID=A0ABV6YN12_UNCEI